MTGRLSLPKYFHPGWKIAWAPRKAIAVLCPGIVLICYKKRRFRKPSMPFRRLTVTDISFMRVEINTPIGITLCLGSGTDRDFRRAICPTRRRPFVEQADRFNDQANPTDSLICHGVNSIPDGLQSLVEGKSRVCCSSEPRSPICTSRAISTSRRFLENRTMSSSPWPKA